MKTFFSTLAAILVAALIIWFVMSINQSRTESIKRSKEMRQIAVKQGERKLNDDLERARLE